MKKIVTALILALLTFAFAAQGIVASDSDNLRSNQPEDLNSGIFTDVSGDDWFCKDVKAVYDAGLLVGKGRKTFDPESYVTVAEICTVAARLHVYYRGTVTEFAKTSPWYEAYFDYCYDNGIFIPVHEDPRDYVTREEFAAVIVRVLPKEILSETSTIVDNAISDVPMEGQYAKDVYSICRSGILQCYKTTFEFFPTLRISRYDLAASLARILDPSLRISYSVNTLYHLSGQAPTELKSGLSLLDTVKMTVLCIHDEYHQGDKAKVGDLCAYEYCRMRPDSFMHSGVVQYGDFGNTQMSVPRKTLYNTAAFLFGNEMLDQNDEEMFRYIPDFDETSDRYIFPLNTDYLYFGSVAFMEAEIMSEDEMCVVNVKLYIYETHEGRWYNYSYGKVTDPGTGIQYYRLLSVELDETKPILTDYYPDNVY